MDLYNHGGKREYNVRNKDKRVQCNIFEYHVKRGDGAACALVEV